MLAWAKRRLRIASDLYIVVCLNELWIDLDCNGVAAHCQRVSHLAVQHFMLNLWIRNGEHSTIAIRAWLVTN